MESASIIRSEFASQMSGARGKSKSNLKANNAIELQNVGQLKTNK